MLRAGTNSCSGCSEATFFHRAGWKSVIERSFGHRTYFLYAEAGGRIEGVLPLAEVSSLLFGHTLVSLPFCVYGGVAARTERARRALDEAARALAEKLRVDHLEYRNLAPQHSDWVSKDLYVTFRKTDRSRRGAQPAGDPAQAARDGAQGHQGGIEKRDRRRRRSVSLRSTPITCIGTARRRCRSATLRCCARRSATIAGCSRLSMRRERRCRACSRSTSATKCCPTTPATRSRAAPSPRTTSSTGSSCATAASAATACSTTAAASAAPARSTSRKTGASSRSRCTTSTCWSKAKRVAEHNPLNPKYRLFIKLWQRMPLPLANLIGPHIVKSLG